MKIIGVGLSRTGSMSLKYALDDLGFPCYHMIVAVENFARGDLDLWLDFMEGRTKMDWDSVFEGYDATVDTPPAVYYEELYEKYPDAKFILTVRNADNWYASLSKLMNMHDTLIEKLTFMPRFKAFQRVYRILEKEVKKYGDDKESIIKYFHAHNDAVKSFIPSEKLLVFEVKDGWGPLCEFLGVEIPDKEFPNLNSGVDSLDKIFKQILIKDLIRNVGPWILGIVVIIILLINFL